MKNNFKMKGGLIKRNPVKLFFQPIHDMIMHPDTRFSVLTFTSLKGFMISMRVTEEASEYLNRNSVSDFTIPVIDFLFKFVIASPKRPHKLNDFTFSSNSYPKSTEFKNDFYSEAILQQKIWLNSIESGKIEVCPSVVNLAFLKNPELLFSIIKSKLTESPNKFNAIEEFLLTGLKKNSTWNIGIIVQSLVKNSIPFDNFSGDKNMAAIYAGAQLVRLFLNYKVIHLDCHDNNILISLFGREIFSFIIDFGDVLSFRDDLPFKKVGLRPDINDLRIEYKNRIDQINITHDTNEKINVMAEIFNLMHSIDLKNLNGKYSTGQMVGLLEYINGHNSTSNILFEQVYDKYIEIDTKKTLLSHETFVKTSIESKRFELIDQPINMYTINANLINDPSIFIEDSCLPCTKEDCENGALIGTVCCIGSCALGVPTIPVIGLGAVTGLMTSTLSAKMKRGGKNSKTKKCKKYRTKKYKTKKYKNKKHKYKNKN